MDDKIIIIGSGSTGSEALVKMLKLGHKAVLVAPEDLKDLPTNNYLHLEAERINNTDRIEIMNKTFKKVEVNPFTHKSKYHK
ncbi:MAG: hypothetical protein ACWA5P_01690 [bacterium]